MTEVTTIAEQVQQPPRLGSGELEAGGVRLTWGEGGVTLDGAEAEIGSIALSRMRYSEQKRFLGLIPYGSSEVHRLHVTLSTSRRRVPLSAPCEEARLEGLPWFAGAIRDVPLAALEDLVQTCRAFDARVQSWPASETVPPEERERPPGAEAVEWEHIFYVNLTGDLDAEGLRQAMGELEEKFEAMGDDKLSLLLDYQGLNLSAGGSDAGEELQAFLQSHRHRFDRVAMTGMNTVMRMIMGRILPRALSSVGIEGRVFKTRDEGERWLIEARLP